VRPFKRGADELHALLNGKERLPLVGVGGDGDDELVEDAERSVDNVEVSVGQGIKAARVDSRLYFRADCGAHVLNTVTIVSP
jgi:hypothetical protein